jgi:hypothetical protein
MKGVAHDRSCTRPKLHTTERDAVMTLVGNVKMSKQELTRSHAGFSVLSSLDRSTPTGRSTYAYPVHKTVEPPNLLLNCGTCNQTDS